MDKLGAFSGVCGACDGTGEFDETDGQYIIPLNDKALDAGIEIASGDAELQEDYNLKDYSQAQAIYNQMGRNFASFLRRNVPAAYFDGVTAKLSEIAGISPRFTR
ncbi:hypothetical protein LCGC14_0847080 [marine sediment metagenome]|uniref:Uncharacterized protein n=1 Tax=marine sediment metagenome TaxID=412755 RepID=A0A0F9SIH9_9ZZZZ